ncbi:MAG: non-canonical purine NTP pyrophosphatase, RdgB/HAM1 family [Phycisphaerae bacterium]|nr:non-canonical purine NTP pyrophosphatase, RdgB/HAM1 family [Phycisphaerae bacterium]
MSNTILLATSNEHKLDEVRQILGPLGFTVQGLDSVGMAIPEPVEDGMTFEENARIKAVSYATAAGRISLADDSGLEIDALGGAPGIHSARFSGVEGSRSERDSANNRKMVSMLRELSEEGSPARFVCAMCLAAPDGRILAETRGEFEGVIVTEPRGENGFGYDPHLYIPDLGLTSAELAPDAKNARSHRGEAVRQMAVLLDAIDLGPGGD